MHHAAHAATGPRQRSTRRWAGGQIRRASRPATLPACPPNSSTPPTGSPGTTRRTGRSSRTSRISFYPGAKIGVIGPNGAGKSSLLRIMAGLDDGFVGEARLTPGFTVGYLEPGARARPDQGRQGQRPRRRRARSRTCIDQYNAVMAKWADPDADYDAIGAEQATLEDRINAADAWNLERNVDIAMDALRCPPDDADVTTLSGGEKRRVALCRLLLQPPGPAAARRADQPPRRRVGRLARALPPGVLGHRRRDHPRPLLPRQRRAVDPRARPRARHPVRGQLLELARAEARPDGARAEDRRRPAADARPRARMGPPVAARPPGQGQGPPRRLRAAPRRGPGRQGRRRASSRSRSRPGPRLGDTVIEVKDLRKAYGDKLLIDGPDVLAAEGRDRRASSAPTAPARRRCSG